MSLEIRPKLSHRDDDDQSQLLNLLITSFSAFEHFAYEIHMPLYLICLLDEHLAHRLICDWKINEQWWSFIRPVTWESLLFFRTPPLTLWFTQTYPFSSGQWRKGKICRMHKRGSDILWQGGIWSATLPWCYKGFSYWWQPGICLNWLQCISSSAWTQETSWPDPWKSTWRGSDACCTS